MPTVPLSPGRRVQTNALPGASISPSAPSAAFGVAESLDVSGPQRFLADIQSKEKQQADQVALLDADNQLNDTATQLRIQASEHQGKNAMGFRTVAADQWQQSASKIRSGLASDEQRMAFDARAAHHWNDLSQTIELHAASEAQKYDDETTTAALENRANAAITATPEQRANLIAETRAIVADAATRHGLSPEVRQAEEAKRVSDIHAGVIGHLLSTEQDQAASAYFQEHKDELTGDQLVQVEHAVHLGSTLGEAQRQSDAILYGTSGTPAVPGLVQSGNIDLSHRPRVKNADGSVSTVRSMSFEEDGKEVLVPTVSEDGRILTEEQAIDQYHRTGKHLGIFANADSATAYAKRLHEAQADMIEGHGTGSVAPDNSMPAVTLEAALARARKIDDPRVRQEVEQRLRQGFADRAAAQREEQAQVFQTASSILEQTGDFHKIPLTLRVKMSPEENASLQRREDQMRHPKRETDMALYTTLMTMAGLNEATRNDFSSVNLAQFRNQLDESDFKSLVNLQLRIREDAIQNDRSRAKNFLDPVDHSLPPDVRLNVPQAWTDSAAANPTYLRWLQHMRALPSTAPLRVPGRGTARPAPGTTGDINLTAPDTVDKPSHDPLPLDPP